MTDHPNPLGVECFEFIEFAAPDAQALHDLFKQLGCVAVARHAVHPLTLYRQGRINFLINETADSAAMAYAKAHGPCCTGFAIRVADPQKAHAHALSEGAIDFHSESDAPLTVCFPTLKGIGGSALYLTDGIEALESQLEWIEGVDHHPKGFGLDFIDHLTHNVHNGNMQTWASFYEKIFGFYEVKYFDIKGKQTGLRSKAMTSPGNKISIPINESEDPKSQINEYIEQYAGEGVQHIALYTDHIFDAVEALRANNVLFLDTPDAYFDMIDERIPDHGEDVARMRANKILIDADHQQPDKKLLQIFTQTNIGPIFFEIIQRQGNDGFGEGNFQALFEAIERDQQQRGVLS
jgi:4-hydroxyphenylpyruvate dioxygenase